MDQYSFDLDDFISDDVPPDLKEIFRRDPIVIYPIQRNTFVYFEVLHDILIDFEKNINTKAEEIEKEMDEHSQQNRNKYVATDFLYAMANKHQKLLYLYTNTFRKQMIVQAISSMEIVLKTIEKYCIFIKNSRARYSSGIIGYKKTIENLTSIIFDKKIWNEIIIINKIRNIIIHNDGLIAATEKQNKAVISYVRRTNDIDIRNDKLVLQASYVIHKIDMIKNFCLGIVQQLAKHYQY